MRLRLWFVLILAFSIGMCCAVVVRTLCFEAKPIAEKVGEPVIKILVAKQDIPAGIEITAGFIVFQEVPISEVPTGSLGSFDQVYRRLSAYPIPAGCPVCEDLLAPQSEPAAPSAFVPLGSQFINLDIVYVRQGKKVTPLPVPLSDVLVADQRIDIRIVPNEAQGKLAEMKNEVLRAFSKNDFKSNGELVLENVPIHQVRRQPVADSARSVKETLTLMLDSNDAAKLANAQKKGQFRIVLRQESEDIVTDPTELSTVEKKNRMEFAESQSDPLLSAPISIGLPQPALENPFALESESVFPIDPVLKNTSVLSKALPSDITASQSISQGTSQVSQSISPFFLAKAELNSEGDVSVHNENKRDLPSIQPEPTKTHSVKEKSQAPKLGEGGLDREALDYPNMELKPLSSQINSDIQFIPINRLNALNEHKKEPEVSLLPVVSTGSALAENPYEIESELPRISPEISSSTVQEKVPSYSPFERHVLTIPPNKNLKALSDDSLLAPPRLLNDNL